MTHADKIAEARALIGFADRMSYVAFRVGLEGTKEWDQIAGATNIYRVQNALSALADLVDAQTQEIERLRYVLKGVRGAIDTGRNEPLTIWREQISIALGETS